MKLKFAVPSALMGASLAADMSQMHARSCCDGRAIRLDETGVEVARCYARRLRSCAGPLSREHYSTRGVLEQMEQMEQLLVSGLVFMEEGETRELPVDAVVARVLCKRHNELLSDVDTEASELYTGITEFIDPRSGEQATRERFCGHKFERWALKFLCGALAGRVIKQSSPLGAWEPPESWLRVLFAQEPMPAGWGLFALVPRKRSRTQNGRSMEMTPVYSVATGAPIGCDLTFSGMRFRLRMSPPEEWDAPASADLAHRPRGLRLRMADRTRVVPLDWGDEAGSGIINVSVRPSVAGVQAPHGV